LSAFSYQLSVVSYQLSTFSTPACEATHPFAWHQSLCALVSESVIRLDQILILQWKARGNPIMVELTGKLKCPLCEGRGEVLRSEIVDRFANPELRKRLDARIAEILEASAMAGVGPKVRNFEKEVHTWNPTLPMWQRSPKE